MKRMWIITKYVGQSLLVWFWRMFDAVWDMFAREWALLSGEGRLYLGAAFFIVGLFSWKADKYCDGNTAEYFACTHPVPYYYYPWWAITLVVVGALLLIGWRRRK